MVRLLGIELTPLTLETIHFQIMQFHETNHFLPSPNIIVPIFHLIHTTTYIFRKNLLLIICIIPYINYLYHFHIEYKKIHFQENYLIVRISHQYYSTSNLNDNDQLLPMSFYIHEYLIIDFSIP